MHRQLSVVLMIVIVQIVYSVLGNAVLLANKKVFSVYEYILPADEIGHM